MCKPIYVSGQRLNRQLTVDYPMLNIKGAQLQGGRGRKGIYTCRRFAYYDDHRDIDSKILSMDYQTNFEATKPSVREPVHISSGLELVK